MTSSQSFAAQLDAPDPIVEGASILALWWRNSLFSALTPIRTSPAFASRERSFRMPPDGPNSPFAMLKSSKTNE